MKSHYVYILASHKHGTRYVGVTNDLERRTLEHKADATKGFTSQYGVKQLKNWKREWKIALIEKDNPEWKDLAAGIAVDSGSSPE